MSNRYPADSWETYRAKELAWATPALIALGYELEATQPHIAGERYLMQAVTTTSGPKLILLVRRQKDGKRAVAKVTSNPGGKRELVHERVCRRRLADITFAYRGFKVPDELHFDSSGEHTISIQAYIDQELPFLERTTPEQFTLALSAFKTQEGAHAATYEQAQSIKKTFGIMYPKAYPARYREFTDTVLRQSNEEEIRAALHEGERLLATHADVIAQYSGFLTHTDFVPHNIRVVGDDIYLLDASSIRFGNKYEGWARFVNFMTLYNPELAASLIQYVADNRTPEESRALRAMRVYRLGEILAYYAGTLTKSEGDLRTLNEARLLFWTQVLRAVLNDTSVAPERITEYQTLRDRLRSPEEKIRQQGLH